MQSKATNTEDYIKELPAGRQIAVKKLRDVFKENLPEGFEETMSYGMIGFVVPHHIFPAGYHCNPKLPLPFINIASQKNFVAIYHMGLYSNKPLLNWYVTEYAKLVKTKLDMGKACTRFKKMENIPYELFAELATKITVQQWVDVCKGYTKQ